MLHPFLQTTYTNPLSTDDFPDPCIIAVAGQGYYAYATHDVFSPGINNIQVKHSRDLVNWVSLGGALKLPPTWALQCHKFWSPHIVQVKEEFRLYYAAEPDTKDGMCLALATSADVTGFTDYGHPVSQKSGSTYQMIDPCLFIDPQSGRQLLYYGSAHEPIRVVELAPDGYHFLTEPAAVLYPGEGKFQHLREGAFVTYQPAYNRYLLWVSGDNTWAENGYAVSVFWSADSTGLFEEIPGQSVVLRPNDHWDAPGHNCIITDAAGNDWIVYHAVDTKDRYIAGTTIFQRRICMDRVFYTSEGWPYIRNGSPSFEQQQGPQVHRW